MHKKNKQKLAAYILLGAGILAAMGFWAYLLFAPAQPFKPLGFNNPDPVFYPFHSALDGSGSNSPTDVYPAITAVMIDNHPDAWPQSGVSQAKIVYEAPAEGGITRFLAIFKTKDAVAQVGPVRSARPYFINWAAEYNAFYLHSGGSPDALNTLASTTLVTDVNEFWNGQYFWRSYNREAPHNLYTSSTLWQIMATDLSAKHKSSPWVGLKFVTADSVLPPGVSTSSQASITFSPNFSVSWHFDNSLKKYVRYVNGKVFEDTAGPIMADNVIIQKVTGNILDEIGRRSLGAVGQGGGWLLRLGHTIEVAWNKSSNSARTVFKDVDMHEIEFAPGVTWIEVVPPDATLKVVE